MHTCYARTASTYCCAHRVSLHSPLLHVQVPKAKSKANKGKPTLEEPESAADPAADDLDSAEDGDAEDSKVSLLFMPGQLRLKTLCWTP